MPIEKEDYMDTRSGKMLTEAEFNKIKEENPSQTKWFKEVRKDAEILMQGMNRKERRAFYKENKKLFTKA